MRHEREHAPSTPSRRKEWHLVDVLDEHVVRMVAEQPPIRATRERRPRQTRADPDDVDTVERRPRGAARPSTAEQGNGGPACRESAKDLMEMDLGASGLDRKSTRLNS